jgi:glycosyltransferase involved in cell wall biosynthesis
MTPDLATVIIPTYNRADLLGEAVGSVVAQTHRPLEILVVDDGSTDDTEQVVARLMPRSDPALGLHYLRQQNSGACAARNRGIRAARGEYLKFLDSDDTLESDALARQVAALRRSGADVAYGDWSNLYMDTRGRVRGRRTVAGVDLGDPVADLLSRRWVANFCYLFTKRAVDASGGWDERLEGNQDFGFALRVAFTGAAFVHTPGIVGSYRRHAGSRVSLDNRLAWARSTELILLEAEAELARRDELTDRLRKALALYHFVLGKTVFAGDRALFRHHLAEAHRLDPAFRHPRLVYRLAARVLGYERAEGVAALCARVKERLRTSDVARK